MNTYQVQQLNDTITFITSILALGFVVSMVGVIKPFSSEEPNRIWLVYVTKEGKWGATDVTPKVPPSLHIHRVYFKEYVKEVAEVVYYDAEAQVRAGRFAKYWISEAPTKYKAIKNVQVMALPEYHSNISSGEEPPTSGQIKYIAILSQQLHMQEPSVKTYGEAGRMIRELEAERKYRKQLKSSNPDTIYGICYEDAWRFIIKQEEGELVHGTVESLGKRIGHAWVELPTGYIWEPQTQGYFTIKDFDVAANPIEEHRYTVEEAAIMLARVGRHGPWTDEERAKWLPKHHSFFIAPEGTPFSPDTAWDIDELTKKTEDEPSTKVEGGAKIEEALEAWKTSEKWEDLKKLVGLTKGSADYRSSLHRILRKQYGDKIIVYRGGRSGIGLISVTPSRDAAAKFQEWRGGELRKFSIDTNKVLVAIPTIENELIVNAAD